MKKTEDRTAVVPYGIKQKNRTTTYAHKEKKGCEQYGETFDIICYRPRRTYTQKNYKEPMKFFL